MNEQNLRAQLATATLRIAELEKELSDLRRIGRQDQDSKIVAPTAVSEKKPFDPFNPCLNDPVFNALRAQHQQKRRSWLDIK